MILEAISEAYKLRRLLWHFLMEILHEEKQRVLSRPVPTQIHIDSTIGKTAHPAHRAEQQPTTAPPELDRSQPFQYPTIGTDCSLTHKYRG